MNWYSIIKGFLAEGGHVVILLNVDPWAKIITVDEALDRADALRGMLEENTTTHRMTADIHNNLMEVTLEAVRQQESLRREGKYVEYALRNNHLRQLELYRASKRVTG
jgi:hypothetical protein